MTVVVDRPCGATEVAARAGVPADRRRAHELRADFDRVAYTQAGRRRPGATHDIDLVAMAGFGTILDKPDLRRLRRPDPQHPPGAAARRSRAGTRSRTPSAYGVKVTGCTVHVATAEVDAGPILAQEAVPVLPDDTDESLHERIKAVERRLYPDTDPPWSPVSSSCRPV